MKYNMKDDIEEILLTEKDLQKAVKKLGKQISADYEGKNLMLVAVLKGSVFLWLTLCAQSPFRFPLILCPFPATAAE